MDLDLGERAGNQTVDGTKWYSEPFNDGPFGMGMGSTTNEGLPDAPEGFGVDRSGTIHAIDGVNHRVILISPTGQLVDRALPDQLKDDWIAGFAVAPDGTEYVSLRGKIAILIDGMIKTEVTYGDAGVVGPQMEMRATADGLYVLSGSRWVRALDSEGLPLKGPQRVELRSQLKNTIDISSDDKGDPVITIGDVAVRLLSSPQLAGVYVADQLSDGSIVLLARSSSSSAEDNTQLILVHPDGTWAHRALAIPTENMVQNGMYAHLVGDTVFLEVGGPDGVSILSYDDWGWK
jgi:hypothetical protein